MSSKRAVIVARKGRITLEELPQCLRPGHRAPAPPANQATAPLLPLAELERLAVMRALEHTLGNERAAAALLGIYRPTLYSKLRKYGIMEPPSPSRAPADMSSWRLRAWSTQQQ